MEAGRAGHETTTLRLPLRCTAAQCPLALPRPNSHPQGAPRRPLGSSVTHGCWGTLSTLGPLQPFAEPQLCIPVSQAISYLPVLPPPPPPPLSPTDVPDQPGPYHRVSLAILSTSFPSRPPSSLCLGLLTTPSGWGHRPHHPWSSSAVGSQGGSHISDNPARPVPHGDGHCCPGSAVGGRCALLLWVFFLPHP